MIKYSQGEIIIDISFEQYSYSYNSEHNISNLIKEFLKETVSTRGDFIVEKLLNKDLYIIFQDEDTYILKRRLDTITDDRMKFSCTWVDSAIEEGDFYLCRVSLNSEGILKLTRQEYKKE